MLNNPKEKNYLEKNFSLKGYFYESLSSKIT